MLSRNMKSIHVYIGGENSLQAKCFKAAVAKLQLPLSTYAWEYLTCKNVKELGWNYTDLIDWGLNGVAHFFITHPHQGPSSTGDCQMGWEVDLLYADLLRLRDHPGFPNGKLFSLSDYFLVYLPCSFSTYGRIIR